MMKKKEETLKDSRKSLKSFITKKKIIIVVIIILLIISIAIIFVVRKNDNKNNSLNKNDNIVKENNKEENSLFMEKEKILNLLIEEIAKYQSICIDTNKSDCISESKKEEIVNNLEQLVNKLNDISDNDQASFDQLKNEINDYLLEIGSNIDLEEIIDNSNINNNFDKKEQMTSNSTNKEVNTSLEGILNSAKLNPIKTGYSSLDKKVNSVISSVTNSSMSTYEKVKALYDWVINNMSYQIGFIMGEEIDALINAYGYYEMDANQIFLASNGFATKKGSCDNYSAMFMILTRRLGLDSYVISARNKNGTGHTTVNIKINGKYYNFDPQREDNSLKNGKIMYYAFGEDDNDSKPYTYINRNKDVSSFHKFSKQPEENYFKASITINGKTYNAKSLTNKYNSIISDVIEVDYKNHPNTTIKVEVDKNVTYMWTTGGHTNLDWENSYVNGQATTDKYGEITINQTYSAKYDYTIHIIDNDGREINFIVHFNFRDASKKLSISANTGDFSYNDYILIGVSSYDSVGNVSYSAKVIETNDPKGASAILIGPANGYTFKISNLDRSNYYYKIEITGTDEAGNVATDIITGNEL